MVDASVFIEYLLPGPREEKCRGLVEDPANELLVPDLVFVEAANGFRKVARRHGFPSKAVPFLIEDLSMLPLISFPTRSLVEGAVPHFEELTAYDSCYLALALERSCPVATFDRALGAAARAAGLPTSLA